MERAPCCEQEGLKKGRWTAEEDEILTNYILANGEGSWRSLPKNAGLLRCGKSYRLRWINYLRADLKRGNKLKKKKKPLSSCIPLWVIAAHLPGRTDNEIKNYWNSHLSRKIYSFARSKNDLMLTAMNITNIAEPSKYRGGRTSRSAIKNCEVTLMSLGKSKSATGTNVAEVHESTTKEKAPSLAGYIEDSQIMGLVPKLKVETRMNQGVHGSSMDGGAERIITAVGTCPSNKEKETEVLGPYEWLDSEIKSLKYSLQSELVERAPRGNNTVDTLKNETENGVPGVSEERGNEVRGLDRVASNGKDRENDIAWSSNGEWYNCCPLVNSRFDEEWFDLDWTGGEHQDQWQF